MGVRQDSPHRCGSAHVAQLEEHVLGKNEVTGSNPVVGSTYGTLDKARVISEWVRNALTPNPRAIT